MTMPEVSYSQLLNQYHTAISKAQNYQEELAKKKEQWEKREREFNITEKLTRELCEDILAKDGEEMKLGEEYSWSSIPINKLIKKTGDVFRQYNSDRTELEKILNKFNTTYDRVLNNYDGIIHMETVAKGLPELYTFNNKARRDEGNDTINIDNKILEAYKTHPKRFIINSCEDFKDKIKKLIEKMEEIL